MNPPLWANPWHNYYQPDPNVYIPPPLSAAQVYGDPRHPYRPEPPRYVSSKYPKLHPLLASDTTRLRFDVKRKPQEIDATTYFANRHISATEAGVRKLRLISKAFPWTIDIESPVPVTCEAVWEALYHALQEPIADSEWGLILKIKKQREVVDKAAKKRMDEDRGDEVKLRRIDYLGEATWFKGLDKDDDFEKLRLLPGAQGCPDTWVVSFET
ncbi:hypothetical protein LshimejAT787_0400530 [Lyophyllum shimeji]|uniref:DUF6699 domain-containing protein n=1 Tax=Lyophyllum shimeji TaxID=47721 RepID=A0A9P3UL40_LYOSH|nr:hypothetical protein LshimejAT787_0400530 [Lyophyllum shimeji]